MSSTSSSSNSSSNKTITERKSLARRRSSETDVAQQLCRYVLDELVTTEQQYIKDLIEGIECYGSIFKQQSTLPLPKGLLNQQRVLLSNVSQIAAVHRVKLLPLMLQHRHNMELLFEQWHQLLDRDYFYCYVIFVASQRASLQLFYAHEVYFKRLQMTVGDPLGIRSYLLKPVQRISKYPLLLNKIIQILFEHRHLISRSLFEVCCRLERRLRELLERANHSDQLNDIKHFHVFHILEKAKFIALGEFHLNDGRRRRRYSCKLFAFNTCLIYAERKGRKQLLLRGNFLLPDVCIVAKSKSFVLCNKQRECEFLCLQPDQLHKWETLVRHLLDQFDQAMTSMTALRHY